MCDIAGRHEVWIGGTLVGQWTDKDLGARNVLLVGLAHDGSVVLAALTKAFDIVPETLRQIRLQYDQEGLGAIVARRPHRAGPVPKIDAKRRARLETLFDAGRTIPEVFAIVGKRWKISRSTVGHEKKRWADRVAATAVTPVPPPVIEAPMPGEAAPVVAQLRLPHVAQATVVPTGGGSASPPSHGDADEVATPIRSGRAVQHLGVWLLIACVHRLGLYDHAHAVRGESVGGVSLRVAFDALIAGFAIGEHTAEGVRRLATPTAPLLLRARRAPSPAWVRATVGEFADDHADVKSQRGGLLMLRMLGQYLTDEARVAAEGEPYLMYIDNHLRPYTGKRTVRRGWRMQDKRVRPGISDYWLHDEDGRPLYRVAVPNHASLVHWLVPMARRAQLAAPEDQRLIFAFDRAGAYPSVMSELLDAKVEAVTYERRPYPLAADESFTETVTLDEEVYAIGETSITHRRSKLPLRRIVVRDAGGRQINLLSTSTLPARRLLEIMRGRWSQENAFKHGVERWGINQLDRRAVEFVPAGTIVPNPARRRLDHALRLLTHEEGAVRIALADDSIDAKARDRLDTTLKDLVQRRADLQAQRSSVPKKAAVEDTELAGKLVQHVGEYKSVVDTLRIACANAESELAALIGPHLEKPAEAKKLLAALFNAPGRVRIGERAISVDLAPAATRAERNALSALLTHVSAMRLQMPGDERPLRLRLQT